jgi:hypothetical protein
MIQTIRNVRIFTILGTIKLNVLLKFLYMQQMSCAICTLCAQIPLKSSYITFKHKEFHYLFKSTGCIK